MGWDASWGSWERGLGVGEAVGLVGGFCAWTEGRGGVFLDGVGREEGVVD